MRPKGASLVKRWVPAHVPDRVTHILNDDTSAQLITLLNTRFPNITLECFSSRKTPLHRSTAGDSIFSNTLNNSLLLNFEFQVSLMKDLITCRGCHVISSDRGRINVYEHLQAYVLNSIICSPLCSSAANPVLFRSWPLSAALVTFFQFVRSFQCR
jgi:hypothetical protein